MIKNISIKNFKSIEDLNLKFSNLTVLSGLNGMGKSSVIQVLLLLKQSYSKGVFHEGLSLNGDLANLGTVKDALYEFAKTEEININIDFDYEKLISKNWNFTKEINDENGLESENNYTNSDFMPHSSDYKSEDNFDLNEIPFFNNKNFKYLNADRLVKNDYDISHYNVVKNNSLGINGQYTTHYLSYYATSKINNDLLFPETEINELHYQVSKWMNEISPGTKIITEENSGSETIKLRYSFESGVTNTNSYKPLNVGFGITYILPILVSLLSSKKGDILIIENPESHIHPKAQSIIGKLIAKVASTGVQVIIETHSDHILNGIRIAVKNNGVNNDFVKLYFFYRKENESKIYTDYHSPNLDQKGKIDYWPENFFDEWENNITDLI